MTVQIEASTALTPTPGAGFQPARDASPPTTPGAGFQPAQDVGSPARTRSKRHWRNELSPRRPRNPDLGQVPYFVTTRCHESKHILGGTFADAAVNELTALRQRYGFLLLAFVFMSNHAHFVIVPAEGFTISQTMRVIKGAIARSINISRDENGLVWQDGFRSDVPKTREALNNYVRYIENNPVKAGLAGQAKDFRYGSGDGRCRADYDAFLDSETVSRAESPRRGIETSRHDPEESRGGPR